MIDKELPPIDSFPKDNKLRVVWAYGAVYKNIGTTRVPEIKIMLVELEPDNSLSTNYFFAKISVAQLDIVRYMTIWLGNQRTYEIWNGFGRDYETNKFFSLLTTTSSSIKFIEKQLTTSYSYFPPYKYKITGIKNKNDYWSFANSTFTKIESMDGFTVIIPSMEMLTSIYVPLEQKIRYKLLQRKLDDVLDEYIKDSKLDGGKYCIEMYDSKAESNIVFLAYAKFNATTRQRLSMLRSSLEKTSPYPERYPVVLPYHPMEMDVVGDGIWLDNRTFFMFRINRYSLPTDNNVESYSVEIEYEQDTSKKKGHSYTRVSQEIEETEIPVTNRHNPHKRNGTKHIKSEIDCLNTGFVVYKEETLTVITNNTCPIVDHENSDNIEDLSSSEADQAKDSEKTGKIAIKEDTSYLKQSDVLQTVIDALYYMKDKKIVVSDNDKVRINEIYFVDEMCELDIQQMATQFYRVLKKDKRKDINKNLWLQKRKIIKHKVKFLGYRNYLLLKIVLTNGKSAYLFEIDRKDDSESYLGMIFNIGNEISENYLTNLLYEIMGKKGALKNIKISALKKTTFKHSVDEDKTLNSSIKRVIKKAIKEKIFI